MNNINAGMWFLLAVLAVLILYFTGVLDPLISKFQEFRGGGEVSQQDDTSGRGTGSTRSPGTGPRGGRDPFGCPHNPRILC